MLVLKERSLLLFMLLLLSISMVAVGCSDSREGGSPVAEPEDASAAPQTPAPQDKPKEPAKPIVVYANDFVEEIGAMFEAATGYKAEVVHGSGAVTLSRIEAERGNPQWDVVWIDGHGSIYGLGERDFLLTGWQPRNLSQLSDEGKEYVPANYAYFPTGIHAAGIIAYNTKEVPAEQVPKTWAEFLNFNGVVGMADPGVAAPAYPLVSLFFYQDGLEASKATFTNLFKRGMRVYPRNPNVAQALVNGEIKVAALQEHNSYALKMAGEPVEIIWPEEGSPGSLRVAAISKETKNLEVAQAFVEFLLDPKTQQQLTQIEDTSSFFTPLAKGVSPRPDREPNAKLLVPPAEWSARHEAEIKQWFADRAVQ